MEVAMRLLFQLQENRPSQAAAQEPAALPERVRQVLEDAGATSVRASHPELPGLYTAELPDRAAIDGVIARLRKLPEIRHAEPDSFGMTF